MALYVRVEEDTDARGPVGTCSLSPQRGRPVHLSTLSVSSPTVLYSSAWHLPRPDMSHVYLCLLSVSSSRT